MDRAGDGMIRQDGAAVAFNRGAFRFARKGYRGNSSEDVWVQDLKTRAFTRLTDSERKAVKAHVQDVNPMWGADGQVYFVSERDGFFTVWKSCRRRAAGAGHVLQKAASSPPMSPDGKTIASRTSSHLTLDAGRHGATSRRRHSADSKENPSRCCRRKQGRWLRPHAR
jgi:Tol biopolymer transport system component